MKPPALQPGDTIGVMAPSSYVERADIEKSTALLEKKGYKVFVHPQTYEREHQSAGSHLQKALALQGLWQRDDIKAIWCAGGGNRTTYLLDALNFEKMKGKPKILIGFSDITALLNSIYKHTGLITYHGPVFKELFQYDHLDHTLQILAGETPPYPLEKVKILRSGEGEGPLIGGNLSVFQGLIGTKDMPETQGALLFLEDAGDHISRFDRMFLHLKRSGALEEITGLILGEFLDLQEGARPFGYMLEDIIMELTEGLDIPVIMDAPFGHSKNLYTFPIGNRAKLTANDKIALNLL